MPLKYEVGVGVGGWGGNKLRKWNRFMCKKVLSVSQ